MADRLAILGQAVSGAGTTFPVYSPAATKSAALSSIVVCNTGGAQRTFRLFTYLAGSSATTASAIAYGLTIEAGETISLTLGVTLAAGDTLAAYGDAAGLTFTAYGNEVS